MLDRLTISNIVDRTLQEDLCSGDATTSALDLGASTTRAVAIAKQSLVVAGAEVFAAAFERLDPAATVTVLVADGQLVPAGAKIWEVECRTGALLMAERSALNLTQRMCGVSTLTKRFVDALPDRSHCRITDTRKTTPGLRPLERYAVRMGGGHNHRDNLGAAILLKDNHIAACGGVGQAVRRARAACPHTSKIEIEVENQAMLEQALEAGADIIMLDNFDDAAVARAVELCAGRALIEVSGGITLERVLPLAKAGVDVISVGALTHSAAAADISLRIGF